VHVKYNALLKMYVKHNVLFLQYNMLIKKNIVQKRRKENIKSFYFFNKLPITADYNKNINL